MAAISYMVVDTETTGVDEQAEAVELAVVEAGWQWHSLVRPLGKVNCEARATHHITDRELKRAPTMEKLLARNPWLFSADYLVAHNALFDVGILENSRVPKARLPKGIICTLRCASHIYPEAPSFKNQVLRYYLDLKPTMPRGLPPHRALPDAIVTHALLRNMLRKYSLEELAEMTKQPVLLRLVRFGMHRGQLWSAVPVEYLQWILKKDFDEDVTYTANHWLNHHGTPQATT